MGSEMRDKELAKRNTERPRGLFFDIILQHIALLVIAGRDSAIPYLKGDSRVFARE